MPSDLLYPKVLKTLDVTYPGLYERVFTLLANCRAKGKDYYAYVGTRTPAEQKVLWAQGRTAPGAIVTNAKPFQSLHNFGAAVDCALDSDLIKKGLQPDWANNKGQYALLKEEGEKLGLKVGVPSVPGGDPGHVQLDVAAKSGMKEREALVVLKTAYDTGGFPAVFAQFDAWGLR